MSEPNSETMRMAAEAAETLIGYYPAIAASDPKIYAAGLVKLFCKYPEHLVAEAIDPDTGIPGECDYFPSLAKVKAFLTILYVVTKCILQGWNKMDRLHLRERSFDVSGLSKICKDPYSPVNMLAPALAWSFHLLITDAILLQKAHRQITGKLITQFVSVGKLDEVLPSCPISITRSPAVAQPLDLAQGVSGKSLQ